VERKRLASRKRWIAAVKTVSTYPPPDLFKQETSKIAIALASGLAQGTAAGMGMLNYFINWPGRLFAQALPQSIRSVDDFVALPQGVSFLERLSRFLGLDHGAQFFLGSVVVLFGIEAFG
jgi:hypothetical protein